MSFREALVIAHTTSTETYANSCLSFTPLISTGRIRLKSASRSRGNQYADDSISSSVTICDNDDGSFRQDEGKKMQAGAIARVIAKRNFRNGGRRAAGRRGKPAGLPHHFGNYFWQPV